MGKFDDVPIEDDTRIKLSLETSFGDYEVLCQKWFWDGYGDSLIFVSEDIADIDDDTLEVMVKDSPLVTKPDADISLKRGERYTFVNFNIETA